MYHGIINVYKEPGYTSHDVVARLRGILKQKKIGHTGTLDPAAEGVLPVCLGMGTRLCDMLADRTKTYEAVLLLGVATDTQDTTGEILKENREEALALEEGQVREAVLSFLGDYAQIPPMYSALKVDGKKLCDLARAGKEVERKPRNVQILDISIKEISLPRVRMSVTCSKGTYIRTLCHDIGIKLGCGGAMEHLIRTRVDRFQAEDSLTLDEIERLRDEGTVGERIVPIEEALASYRPLICLPEGDRALHNGNPCFKPQIDWERTAGLGNSQGSGNEAARECLQNGCRFRLYDSAGVFAGVYEYQQEKHWLKPWKMFFSPETKIAQKSPKDGL
ncbi:tRNA pseudouridine(55) synthase TruB [Lacrimispora sp. 210928-DFI.3.58]|uniref:tRNA pseudouridine(55) synthase TruB n=1 Tax=Lacrimispora sp. 210928-DFI.3.58 TaxID=2883214 RepID=UPI001D0681EF|nr:tRNA pseudouridine(55) synthase TruB [Lacrimispora sp. 210928-DFI.3.58]MCB7320542.1 tRNA pseudouridine(55) synthase TruB [Lacrimispora sp. 210928-DFI.3.58]